LIVVCAGTATDIGKTYTGAAVLAALRTRGLSVSARKPAQSFDPADNGPLDAEVLAGATGESSDDVCPRHRTYEVALAPPMAADVLGRPIPTLDALLDELRWPAPPPDVAWLETVGGVRSPIGVDADTVTLCERVGPDLVVLVAHAGLGTISDVRLATDALRRWPTLVFLNRYSDENDLHRMNAEWLQQRDGLQVVHTIDDLAASIVLASPTSDIRTG
jgi:dethiobiotin synthetase